MREKQIKRLEEIRASRDNDAVQKALDDLTRCAETGEGNLLALAIEAAKLRATVGEISYAVEKHSGRHVASDQIVRGAYSKEAMENTND